MNDDDSDLISWATDDEGANLDLASQSAEIRNATLLGQIRNGRSSLPCNLPNGTKRSLPYDEQPRRVCTT
ncbi:hypothetical protein FOYG_17581 [Fusarium oxysporum NRRL 32931]|uniref:Uncharacterized protein n=1 Tax=Fusarium oxysporum NRRL 32931 TaxID=660029 RepID=W9HE11_FUSOX|nr:hypothetical protein FOYG_17581 [Fusarium oxysporum NRRL 32931]